MEISSIIYYISQPWHWAISGVAIALIMFLLTWMGKSFGVSTVFRNICAMGGAGKSHDFFKVDLNSERWRTVFLIGAILGGFLTSQYLASPEAVAISEKTSQHLVQDWNIAYPQGAGFLPEDVINFGSLKGILIALIGGFLVGFGARYAGGCTSGHAITGLSHLQLSSLVTVIGFFIGGLIMTWGIMPLIFGS